MANEIPGHLSPSQLNGYTRCGVQWEFRYIQNLRLPPSGAMMRGSALDDASNQHYTLVATSGQGMELKEFVEIAVGFHRAALEEKGDAVKLDMHRDQSTDIVALASENYFNKIAQAVTPRSAEDIQKRVEHTTQAGVPIVGVIDIVTQGPKEAGILDTKLKGRFPSQTDVDNSLQLATYSMMELVQLTGLAVVKPTGETRLIMTRFDEGAHNRTALRYERMWDYVHKGIAMPAIPGTWYCSEKWCGYWHLCPFGSAGRIGARDKSIDVQLSMPTPTMLGLDDLLEERDDD